MAGNDNGTSLLEITRIMINNAFYMLVVYINLGYLIPRFLNQKNFMTYVLLLLALVAVFTPSRSCYSTSPTRRWIPENSWS
jgi:surface polysaccharide O-acyltransferase-like enzyme